MAQREPETVIILTPGTTDSVNSDPFAVLRNEEVTITLYGTLGADTGTLKRRDPEGNWVTCTDDNGDIVLSATRTMEVIVGLGTYRVEVATRTGSWGIAIAR